MTLTPLEERPVIYQQLQKFWPCKMTMISISLSLLSLYFSNLFLPFPELRLHPASRLSCPPSSISTFVVSKVILEPTIAPVAAMYSLSKEKTYTVFSSIDWRVLSAIMDTALNLYLAKDVIPLVWLVGPSLIIEFKSVTSETPPRIPLMMFLALIHLEDEGKVICPPS